MADVLLFHHALGLTSGSATAANAELFLYAGNKHLFADRSLPSYDAAAAALLTERALGFLARLG
jgi:dienelactone hydrolase